MVEQFLKDNQHWLVGLMFLGVLALVYKAWKDAGLSVSLNREKSGFYSLAAGSNGWEGERSDGYPVSNDLLSSAGRGRSGVGGVSGMLAHEPPVFWAAGDMAEIMAAQNEALAGGSVSFNESGEEVSNGMDYSKVKGPGLVKLVEGYRSPAQYARSGMENSRLNPWA